MFISFPLPRLYTNLVNSTPGSVGDISYHYYDYKKKKEEKNEVDLFDLIEFLKLFTSTTSLYVEQQDKRRELLQSKRVKDGERRRIANRVDSVCIVGCCLSTYLLSSYTSCNPSLMVRRSKEGGYKSPLQILFQKQGRKAASIHLQEFPASLKLTHKTPWPGSITILPRECDRH